MFEFIACLGCAICLILLPLFVPYFVLPETRDSLPNLFGMRYIPPDIPRPVLLLKRGTFFDFLKESKNSLFLRDFHNGDRTHQNRLGIESEPSLAAAADACQGDEAPVITQQQLAQVGNLPIASDEGRGVRGQVVVVAVQRRSRASHRIPSTKVPPFVACAKE